MTARRVMVVAVVGLWAGTAQLARAEVTAGETEKDLTQGIDDPKVARRLGTRISPAGYAATDTAAAAPAAAAPPAASGGPATVARAAQPAPARPELSFPHVGLSFRRFDFVRVGATAPGSTTGTTASEPFASLALDVYPVSSIIRFGLSSQYGWQSGSFGGGADYFFAQSLSLGSQFPILSGGDFPWHQITMFAEGYLGGGYMRRLQFDVTVPTVYWQFGVDVGADIFVAQHGYLSLAFGYLHPVNGFATTKMTSGVITSAAFTTVFVDTWSLKVGLGF